MNKPNIPNHTSPRRARNREQTIQTILETARIIMREKGAAALTMQELARRLDMRAPSLYNYFSGIMEIYDALFRLGFTLWGVHIEQFTQGAQSWMDELRLALEAYMRFALEHPELYQLCFERPIPDFEPSEESMQLSLEILHKGYAKIAALRDQLNTDLSAEQITDIIIAMMHGLTALHIANQPHLPLGEGRFGSLIPAVLTIFEKAWSGPNDVQKE